MSDITADTCIECGVEWDDHTVRAFREHWPIAHPNLDMPYEPRPGDQVPVGAVADNVMVAAVAVRLPDGAEFSGLPPVLPGLRFWFGSGDAPLTEATLIMGEEQMRQLRLLVSTAIDDAMRQARRAR